jgi:hypothetical protein
LLLFVLFPLRLLIAQTLLRFLLCRFSHGLIPLKAGPELCGRGERQWNSETVAIVAAVFYLRA